MCLVPSIWSVKAIASDLTCPMTPLLSLAEEIADRYSNGDEQRRHSAMFKKYTAPNNLKAPPFQIRLIQLIQSIQ